MKYFLGITLPLVTRERILEIQKSYPSNKVPYLYEPHITLKRSVGLTEDKAWLAKVMSLIGNYSRFSLELNEIGEFEDNVLFLRPAYSDELINLHKQLVSMLSPNPDDNKKSFEGDFYNPHCTLGETTWGGMTSEELIGMKKKAEIYLSDIPPFQVDFVRLFQKENEEIYAKLIDIPLKL